MFKNDDVINDGYSFFKKISPKYPKVNSSESNKISGISDQKKTFANHRREGDPPDPTSELDRIKGL